MIPYPPGILLRPLHFAEARIANRWIRIGAGSPEFLKRYLDTSSWCYEAYVDAVRITARVKDGRTLVLSLTRNKKEVPQ